MRFGKDCFDWEVKTAYVVRWSWIHFVEDLLFDSLIMVAGQPKMEME